MEATELLGLAASASLLAGWRLYLTVAMVGLAMRYGWAPLPEELASLNILANPWIIGIAGAGAVAEFLADKVMWLDSLWDGIHTFIRPAGGALIALALVDPADPAWQVVALLLGGGASLATHGAKMVARAAVNLSPEPASNIIVSLMEDVLTFGLLVLVINYPVTAAVVALVLLVLSITLLVVLGKLVRRVWRARRRAPSG